MRKGEERGQEKERGGGQPRAGPTGALKPFPHIDISEREATSKHWKVLLLGEAEPSFS